MEKTGISRRDFIVGATLVAGAGAVALNGGSINGAAMAAEPAKAGVIPVDTKFDKPTYLKVLEVSREKLYPLCRVCPECDGWACSGEVPGFGGIDTGAAFRNNVNAWRNLRLNMNTTHEVSHPVMSTELWGVRLETPILTAPTGGVSYNMGNPMSEGDYINALLNGAAMAGSIAFVADGIGDPVETYQVRLSKVPAVGGRAIGVIKPRAQEEIFSRIDAIKASGALAFAIDITSAGRAARALPGQIVEPKSEAKLREIVKYGEKNGLPFIAKGIMTPESAKIALNAGCAGIVVSNHGGRVIDNTPGTSEVFEGIKKVVKKDVKVFVDGGLRYGQDVLKALALGADYVLIGRPVIRGAVGGGPEGVALILNKYRSELQVAMTMTGVADVKNVSKKILV